MGNQTLNRQIVASNGANNATGVAVVLPDSEIDTEFLGQVNIEIRITGTPTGTLTCEGTNQADPLRPGKAAAVTFITLPAAAMSPALPAVAGAALNYIGDLISGVRFVRWRYVNSASAGTLDMWVNGTSP